METGLTRKLTTKEQAADNQEQNSGKKSTPNDAPKQPDEERVDAPATKLEPTHEWAYTR